ncbi:MAG: ferric-dicitrate binding protein FerR (iron transport regulator) [Myxococcota bacterium]|jgi:ferric-dicitrate binding protein FerR (iron transport regulator)
MASSKRARARRRERKLRVAMREGSVAIKSRDPHALAASLRSGSGRHTDRKKEASRKACRKPVGSFYFPVLAISTDRTIWNVS